VKVVAAIRIKPTSKSLFLLRNLEIPRFPINTRFHTQFIRIGACQNPLGKVLNFLLNQINLILKAAMNSCSLGPHCYFLRLQALSGSLQPEMEVVMFRGK
jgi:hypothetical protein